MSRYKVLVAGRSGQVARELARNLPAGQFEAVFLGRPDLDICDLEAVDRAARTFRPDIVINAAAYTAVDQAETDQAAAFALNATAAGHLAAAAAGQGAAIIQLSTDYVFDGTAARPYVETDPVAPLGVYGRSKLEGERLVAAANARHVILRTAWVYSPFGKNFVKTMLRLAAAREEIGVVDDQLGNPTAAADIARGIWSVAARLVEAPDDAAPGVYHMTAAGEGTWADFAEAVFVTSRSLGGPTANVRRITSADYPTPVRRPADSRLAGAKLKDTYAVALPHWRQSAERCVRELIETEGWTT